ncbi:hypothetical protein H4R34_002270 [Dimargaris verticillata]|uniref:Uncharacterized protein n=1 Tax=Dimargaris verticillata TaxID=2761393 RepID=A0A9W8E9F9_9FUNG|nr:hypothetical protein H4R34_002270 [Dimargaris verticillata]
MAFWSQLPREAPRVSYRLSQPSNARSHPAPLALLCCRHLTTASDQPHHSRRSTHSPPHHAQRGGTGDHPRTPADSLPLGVPWATKKSPKKTNKAHQSRTGRAKRIRIRCGVFPTDHGRVKKLQEHWWQMDRAPPQRLPLTEALSRGYRCRRITAYSEPRSPPKKITWLLRDQSPLYTWAAECCPVQEVTNPELSNTSPSPPLPSGRYRPPTATNNMSVKGRMDRLYALKQIQAYCQFMDDVSLRHLQTFDETRFLAEVSRWPMTAPWYSEMLTYLITRVGKRTFFKSLTQLNDMILAKVREAPLALLHVYYSPMLALLKSYSHRHEVQPFEAVMNTWVETKLPLTEAALSQYLILLSRCKFYNAATQLLRRLPPDGPKPTVSYVNVWLQAVTLQGSTAFQIPNICALLSLTYPPLHSIGQPMPARYRLNGTTFTLLLQHCQARSHLAAVWRLACRMKLYLQSDRLFDSEAFQLATLKACITIGSQIKLDLARKFYHMLQQGHILPSLFDQSPEPPTDRVFSRWLMSPLAAKQLAAMQAVGSVTIQPWVLGFYWRVCSRTADWATIKEMALLANSPQLSVNLALITNLFRAIARQNTEQTRRLQRHRHQLQQSSEKAWRRSLTRPLPSIVSTSIPSASTSQPSVRQAKPPWQERFFALSQKFAPSSTDSVHESLLSAVQLAVPLSRERYQLLQRLWALALHQASLLATLSSSSSSHPLASILAAPFATATIATQHTYDQLFKVPSPSSTDATTPAMLASTKPLPPALIIAYAKALGALGCPHDLATLANALILQSHPNSEMRGWGAYAPVYRPNVFRSLLTAAWTSTQRGDWNFVQWIFQAMYPAYQEHYDRLCRLGGMDWPMDVRGCPHGNHELFPKYKRSLLVREKVLRQQLIRPRPNFTLLPQDLHKYPLAYQTWVYFTASQIPHFRSQPIRWLLNLPTTHLPTTTKDATTSAESVVRAVLAQISRVLGYIISQYLYFDERELRLILDRIGRDIGFQLYAHRHPTRLNAQQPYVLANGQSVSLPTEEFEIVVIEQRARDWSNQVVETLALSTSLDLIISELETEGVSKV